MNTIFTNLYLNSESSERRSYEENYDYFVMPIQIRV